jgi:hypothetical protein
MRSMVRMRSRDAKSLLFNDGWRHGGMWWKVLANDADRFVQLDRNGRVLVDIDRDTAIAMHFLTGGDELPELPETDPR